MKKPSLRFRQVFEHPTHFKVVKPIGNPMIIAKKGLSPSLQGRLRKFAEGGEVSDEVPMPAPGTAVPVKDESSRTMDFAEPFPTAPTVAFESPLPLQPRSAEEIDKQIEELKKLDVEEPAAVEPVMVAPAPAPVVATAIPTPASVREDTLEIPEPVVATPALRGMTLGVGALQPVVPTAVVPQPAAVLPSPEERAKKIADDTIELKKQSQADLENAQKEMRDEELRLQQEREKRAQENYNTKVSELNDALEAERKAKEGKPVTAGRIVGAIGNAISLALGAFASGLSGMPNYALQIYNAGVEEELKRAREDRESAYNKTLRLGLDVKDADALFRAQQDKTLAIGLQRKADAVTNAEVRAKLIGESQKILLDAREAESKVAVNLANASKAEAEAAGVAPKIEIERLEQQRKAVKDYMDAYNDANKIKITDADSVRQYQAKMFEARRKYDADMAKLGAGSAADMGAPIPSFLKGAPDKEVRKYRVEYDVPVRNANGEIVDQRRVGFLVDPATRKDFIDRSTGFSIAKRQAEELRDWAKQNPFGLAGIAAKDGVSKANQERERLEPLVKTMTEGYVKNVTGIRRASSAAIQYMEGVVKDPSKINEFINLYLGGSTARFNEIIKEIDAGEASIRNKYISGGVPSSPESEPGRGVPGRRAGQ